MIAQVACSILHLYWCHLFIIKLDYRIYGAGLAMTVSNLVQFTIITILSHNIPRIKDALFWPTMDSFREWNEYLSISLPATMMLCAEWWAFEINVVASGYFGVAQLAANTIA